MRLAGLLKAGLSQGPADPASDQAMSFRTVLLQQVRGALDRTSLSLSDMDVQPSPPATQWDQLLTFLQGRSRVTTPGPALPQGSQRAAKLARGFDPSRPVQHPWNAPQHRSVHVKAASSQGSERPAPAAVAALAPGSVVPASPAPKPQPHPAGTAEGFLDKLAGVAQVTAEVLGLSPHLLLAQAALETGWGRRTIKDAQGQESHNLFGIKAGNHWTGKTVDVKTTEFVHGIAQQKVETFRAYDTYAASFADYAKLIKHRYGDAMAKGATAEGFGAALQAKGYATDPNYAQKIARVAQSVAYRLNSMQA